MLGRLLFVLLLAAPADADVRRLEPEPSDVVGKVIKAHAKAFRTCFARELNRDPAVGRGGKVVLAVALDKEGVVASAKVASTTLKYKTIEDCLVREMKTLRFPAEAPRTFEFPFVFSAA
jgi:hypothetical protein